MIAGVNFFHFHLSVNITMIQKVDVRIFHLGRDYKNNLVSRVKRGRNKSAFWELESKIIMQLTTTNMSFIFNIPRLAE